MTNQIIVEDVYIRVTNPASRKNYIGKVIQNKIFIPFMNNVGEVMVVRCEEFGCNACKIGQCVGTTRIYDSLVDKIEYYKYKL